MDDSVLSSEFASSPGLVKKLRENGMMKTYHEGDIILDENSSIRSIPIVMKGMMKVIAPRKTAGKSYCTTSGQARAASCLFSVGCITKKAL